MKLPNTPSFSLDGKRALVTGASSGIGLGAACALAQAGASVTLVARTESNLITVADAMRERGYRVTHRALDVTNQEDVQAFIEEQDTFDVLVNNAGANRPGPFGAVTQADYDAVMEINVKAAFFVAQSVAKRMQDRAQGGVIINVSSQMGHVGGIDRTIYCASKHAVEGLTKAMAVELAVHQIRVNTICPTFIATPLAAETLKDPERVAWIQSKIKLGRIGEIEDIMGPIVFLASDAASLITGASLLVDGGWTAG